VAVPTGEAKAADGNDVSIENAPAPSKVAQEQANTRRRKANGDDAGTTTKPSQSRLPPSAFFFFVVVVVPLFLLEYPPAATFPAANVLALEDAMPASMPVVVAIVPILRFGRDPTIVVSVEG